MHVTLLFSADALYPNQMSVQKMSAPIPLLSNKSEAFLFRCKIYGALLVILL